MSWSDPIADMLTRIRNALGARRDAVEMPYSRIKSDIATVLKKDGYITDYTVEGGKKKTLRVYLKYIGEEQDPAIRGLKRESKPGLRKYVAADEIPRVLSGLGIAVLSTSHGVIDDREARRLHVGGELICSVW